MFWSIFLGITIPLGIAAILYVLWVVKSIMNIF